MSHIYNADFDVLLERARAAGMTDLESSGWRRRLDPVALDLCGCEASARATAVVGPLGGAAVLAGGGRRGGRASGLVAAVAATAVTAVAAKLLGQRAAQQRRDLLLRTLTGRIQELEARNSYANSQIG
jgi:hypothetical protein